MNEQRQTILLTGATGIIGAILTRELLATGYRVIAVTRPNSSNIGRLPISENLKQIPLVMEDFSILPYKVDEKCDGFIHLAWSHRRNDFLAQEKSFNAALAVLKAAKDLGCARFIGIGSQAEYGVRNDETTENDALSPVTYYGAFKAAASHVTRIMARELELEWIWGRIFSVYGGYEPFTSLISYLITELSSKKSPELTEAKQYWDYLYVTDAAKAIVALLKKGKPDNIYNIASGDVRPLRNFTEEIREIIANDVPINYGAKPAVGGSLMPSVDKIYKDTGWQATVKFSDGILRLIKNY